MPETQLPSPPPRFALTCTGCGQSLEAQTKGWLDAAAALASGLGFQLTTARLELFGCCAACRLAAAFPAQEGRA
ncbi:MAG: hypothetical protein QM767_01250 [Anaeromyxobacter sp.]